MTKRNTKRNEVKSNNQELSAREQLYFNIMKSGNVLYIKGRPGEAKSAIGNAIANKTKYNYITLNLSQMTEVDLGQFPNVSDVDTDNGPVKMVTYVTPKWAIEANQHPTIIHFEELNRCRQEVMDASLLILNDKKVGSFQLNENVLMMASGNLGEDDGTNVNDLGNAVINRMFHYKHFLTVDEWVANYAKENVHPSIVNFLENKPEFFYKFAVEQGNPFATPRSWTNLSKYIKIFNTDDYKEIYNIVSEVGYGFVGDSIIPFMRFIESTMALSIKDIISNYDQMNLKVSELNRAKVSELLQSLQSIDIETLKTKEFNNVVKFITDLNKVSDFIDESYAYILSIIDNITSELEQIPNTVKFLKKFKSIINEIKKLNK